MSDRIAVTLSATSNSSTTPPKSATGPPRPVRLDRDETERNLSPVRGLTISQSIGLFAQAKERRSQKVAQIDEAVVLEGVSFACEGSGP